MPVNSPFREECRLPNTCHILDNAQIYPNPVLNILNIGNIASKSQIEIYNLNGKLLIERIAGSDHETIDVSSLSTGMYIVKLRNSNSISTTKFVKR